MFNMGEAVNINNNIIKMSLLQLQLLIIKKIGLIIIVIFQKIIIIQQIE